MYRDHWRMYRVYNIRIYIYIVLVCLPCCVDVLGLFSHLLVAQVCTNMY